MSSDVKAKNIPDEGGFEKQERKVGFVRRVMPRSLFGRSMLILVTPVLLIQIVTTLFFVDRHWSKVTGRLSQAVAGEIAVISQAIEDGIDSERMLRISGYTQKHLYLDTHFKEGAQLGDDGRDGFAAPLESLFIKTLQAKLTEQLQRPFVLDVDFEQKRVDVRVQLENGVLEIGLPERRLFSSSGYVFLLWVFGSSILLLTVSVIFMRNQIRPIRKLAVAAKRLGRGRDVPSFKPEGAREVRDAAQAFMDMHRRIKRQMSQRTAMLAGVSHDLRTPLTRLKLQLAMLGDTPDIIEMKNDISEMEKMINGYLDFVRGEGGEQPAMTDLNVVFGRVFKALDHQDVIVHASIADGLNATVRPNAFERALSNVVQNAAKYADEIWVEAAINDERKLVIRVDDNGPGIPEEQLEDVFKPFYRLDEARQTDGVGLGLPIAMDVVHAHGGKIWLEKSEQGGLRVNIRMPI
jgi:two-component system osmolarity sensor histidine kinase EnvZ